MRRFACAPSPGSFTMKDRGAAEARERLQAGMLTERKRLAGKPFKIAMLAEMHDRMHPQYLTKPYVRAK